MLFNSIEYLLFLPIVFLFYWFVFSRELRIQNLFLILASYVFYGWWDWRFLILIIFSSFVDYTIGIRLAEERGCRKKILLSVSLLVNLGLLGFFKYYNFFIESFIDAFRFFGSTIRYDSLEIILPVGISFYTFQTLSYSIDIYNGKLNPTKDWIAFFAFVSFFPQLVAGPIERATNLLPQFSKKRDFKYFKAVDGLRQILWGLFKKIVIADNCAYLVNEIFANYIDYSGGILLIGSILFAFQIYCDFSGYSDIAIGTARLFGFNLMQNFAFPYFSRNVGEFWRRWHISLSTWFRDYLYIPLGGSKGGNYIKIRNTFAIFLVSGLWHGANWTFVTWGFLNACYFLPLLLFNSNRKYLDVVAKNRLFPTYLEFTRILFTFFIICIAWVFFRAETIVHGVDYIYIIFRDLIQGYFFTNVRLFLFQEVGVVILLMLIVLIVIEWIQRDKQHGLELFEENTFSIFRKAIYIIIVFFIILFGSFEYEEFIYFQF